MNGPAPGLVSEWLDWPFVATVTATWALAELALFAHRWRRESRTVDADLAVMGEQARRAAKTGRWTT